MIADVLVISLLIGVVAAVILAIGIMRHINNRWMKVITVDADGKQVGKSEWVRNPRPDRFRQDGMSHVDRYVTRFTESSAAYASLSIFSPDCHRGLSLDKKDGRIDVSLLVDWRKEPERETAVRAFFAKRGTTPTLDYLAANGDVPDATRILHYPVRGDSSTIAHLCREVLQDLCAIEEHEALDFKYQEHERRTESSCPCCSETT